MHKCERCKLAGPGDTIKLLSNQITYSTWKATDAAVGQKEELTIVSTLCLTESIVPDGSKHLWIYLSNKRWIKWNAQV